MTSYFLVALDTVTQTINLFIVLPTQQDSEINREGSEENGILFVSLACPMVVFYVSGDLSVKRTGKYREKRNRVPRGEFALIPDIHTLKSIFLIDEFMKPDSRNPKT